MPIPFTDTERAALRRGAVGVYGLIDFWLDSGRYSFWDGPENFAFDGTTYLASSDFGEVGEIQFGADLGAEGLEVKLNGTRLMQLAEATTSPGWLFGTIEQENYQLRRVDIKFAFFDADTRALLFTKQRYAGLIDQMRQVQDVREGAAEEWLVVALESVVRRYGVRGGRTRTHEDQREIDPLDEFFLYTAPSVAGQGTLTWGHADSTPKPGLLGLGLIRGFANIGPGFLTGRR